VIDIIDTILSIDSNAKVAVRGNDVRQIEWLENTTPIAESDILAKQKELQTAYDNAKYQRERAEAYPSIGEQLDLIYHAGIGGDAFQAAIKAVKDKYPKG
jgi:hypothetical protein|tara:strand:+ start:378 stop:677 length:300 start_codon:yes stop_codon:yes gene_type:complete